MPRLKKVICIFICFLTFIPLISCQQKLNDKDTKVLDYKEIQSDIIKNLKKSEKIYFENDINTKNNISFVYGIMDENIRFFDKIDDTKFLVSMQSSNIEHDNINLSLCGKKTPTSIGSEMNCHYFCKK